MLMQNKRELLDFDVFKKVKKNKNLSKLILLLVQADNFYRNREKKPPA